MSLRNYCLGAAAVGLVATLGCEQMENEGEVADEIQDLQEARKNTDQEVNRLTKELSSAKKRVKQLEKDLALAKDGITQEVLEERKELTEALREDRQAVRGEISEARKEAQQHNEETNAAESLLKQTAPPAEVKAEVQSSSEVEESNPDIETTKSSEKIQIEKVKGVGSQEQKGHEQKGQDQ